MSVSSGAESGTAALVSYEEKQFGWAREELNRGDLDAVCGGTTDILVSYRDGMLWQVGDVVTLHAPLGEKQVRIAGILSSANASCPAGSLGYIICSEELFTESVGAVGYAAIDVQLGGGRLLEDGKIADSGKPSEGGKAMDSDKLADGGKLTDSGRTVSAIRSLLPADCTLAEKAVQRGGPEFLLYGRGIHIWFPDYHRADNRIQYLQQHERQRGRKDKAVRRDALHRHGHRAALSHDCRRSGYLCGAGVHSRVRPGAALKQDDVPVPDRRQMGNRLAASGSIAGADRHPLLRLRGAGHPAADQEDQEAVHCGYDKAAAIRLGCSAPGTILVCGILSQDALRLQRMKLSSSGPESVCMVLPLR